MYCDITSEAFEDMYIDAGRNPAATSEVKHLLHTGALVSSGQATGQRAASASYGRGSQRERSLLILCVAG